MIRVVVVDDHPAMRLGLESALSAEPGIVLAGSIADVVDLWPALHRTRPDMVLLDYQLRTGDGLSACRMIKEHSIAPRVLIYTAYASQQLAIPAALAGADGLVGKGVPARELFDAIRRVYRGERVLEPLMAATFEEAVTRLDEEDLPILGMLLDRTPEIEVAGVLGIEPAALAKRVNRMIARLRIQLPELAV